MYFEIERKKLLICSHTHSASKDTHIGWTLSFSFEDLVLIFSLKILEPDFKISINYSPGYFDYDDICFIRLLSN